ncbi:MAG: hypothetical protein KF868_10025 [Acidobacteria bacterium]|nr:hypothetical protein [Acidobacteriota bacterium]
MAMKKLIHSVLVSLLCLTTASGSQQSSQNKSCSILIRKDRPSLYIEFERSGKAPPLFEGEKEERIWLRLYNNTQWVIEFCSFSVKDHYGGIGIVHEVRRYQTSFGRIDGSTETAPLPKERNQEEPVRTPQGYSTSDTCTPYSLGSGKSVIFSIPREHLGKNLHIVFEYWPEWENRDNELANSPQYYLTFSNQILPSSER